jgi:predicted flap endonuclease-1-like 5' DNA nuclease
LYCLLSAIVIALRSMDYAYLFTNTQMDDFWLQIGLCVTIVTLFRVKGGGKMNSTSNPAKSAGIVTLAFGVLIVVISLVFSNFNIADNFFMFDLTQVLWVGIFFMIVGAALWLLPLVANSRGVALLIIAIGVAGIVIAAAYTYLNIADNFLGFDLLQIFWISTFYVVVGAVLLFFARDTAPKSTPTVRETQSKPSAAKPEPRVERPTLEGVPAVPSSAYAPRPTPEDLTIIDGIGDKVQAALNQAGVFTFSQLANMTAEEIYQVVKVEQGVRIVGDTATWAKQAQYIVDGDTAGLLAYQKKLSGGREVK